MIDHRDFKGYSVGDLRPYLQVEQSQQIEVARLRALSSKEILTDPM